VKEAEKSQSLPHPRERLFFDFSVVEDQLPVLLQCFCLNGPRGSLSIDRIE
jgi:hypothetical protein